MRGAMYNGVKQDVTLAEWPMPEVKPGTLLVKNILAGICGTDLAAYLKDGDAVGIVAGNRFGHEMVAEIVEVGEGLEGFKPGQIVFVNPGQAREVPEGWTPTMSCDMIGAFSEYVLVEKPQWGVSLFEIPEGVPYEKAVLVEPLGVSMNSVMVTDAKPGDKAIVYGAGPIGLGVLASLRFKGVTDIIVSDTSPNRLEVVKEMGGIPCDVTKKHVNDFAKELWGTEIGNLGQETTVADIVIDCAGHPRSLRDYMDCAKMGSKFAAVALGNTMEEVSVSEICLKVVNIIASCAYTPETIKNVIALIQSDIPVTPMITAVYGLSDVTEAFKQAADGSKNIKVIIDHSK